MSPNPAPLELRQQERPMTSLKLSVAIVLVISLCACKVGPNYKRPATTVPDQYRGLPPSSSQQPQAQPFADMQWATVYQDEVLQGLIKEALVNNYDLRIAATRVLQANANLGITRANQLPTLNGSGSIFNERNQLTNLTTDKSPTYDSLALSLSYIVDFWGQYRRATESARATLLATQFGQEVVRVSLISSVATDYFLLRQYDDQLEFSKKTVEVDREILKLNEIKFKGGESAITDVYQGQTLLQQAEAQVISTQQFIEQTENNISILLGRNPGPIVRGLPNTAQPQLPDVPTGLPSALLERRPDVRQAEENLVAANANVGVAKAAFFPQISLTGTFGAQSTALTSFLQGPATFWAVGGYILGSRRPGTPADLPGRPHQEPVQVGLGAARRCRAYLQANRAAGIRRSLQQSRRLQPVPALPHEDPAADYYLQADGGPGKCALSGRRHQFSRGAVLRAAVLPVGSEPVTSLVYGAAELCRAVSGAWRRMAAVALREEPSSSETDPVNERSTGRRR